MDIVWKHAFPEGSGFIILLAVKREVGQVTFKAPGKAKSFTVGKCLDCALGQVLHTVIHTGTRTM